jgi:hypothetical protein
MRVCVAGGGTEFVASFPGFDNFRPPDPYSGVPGHIEFWPVVLPRGASADAAEKAMFEELASPEVESVVRALVDHAADRVAHLRVFALAAITAIWPRPVKQRGETYVAQMKRLRATAGVLRSLLSADHRQMVQEVAQRLFGSDGVRSFPVPDIPFAMIRTRRKEQRRLSPPFVLIEDLELILREFDVEIEEVEAAHRRADLGNAAPEPKLHAKHPYEKELKRLVSLWQVVVLNDESTLPTNELVGQASRALGVPATARHVRAFMKRLRDR